MFADLFVPNTERNPDVQMQPTPSSSSIPMQPLVRMYGSEHEMLVDVHIPASHSPWHMLTFVTV